MRKKGFEPSQALSHESLNLARLTTPALPHKKNKTNPIKKLTIAPPGFEPGSQPLFACSRARVKSAKHFAPKGCILDRCTMGLYLSSN